MEGQKSGNGAVLWGVAVVVVALIAFGGYKYMNKTAPAVTEAPAALDTTPAVDSVNQTSSVYKDGTYSAVGKYNNPGGGEESINVSVTLGDDVVKDVTVTGNAARGDSKKYQEKFISGYKTLVVGKKISDVALTKVSGSSLTPKGFMDALAKIETQAKA